MNDFYQKFTFWATTATTDVEHYVMPSFVRPVLNNNNNNYYYYYY
jgi:hypothetical protein